MKPSSNFTQTETSKRIWEYGSEYGDKDFKGIWYRKMQKGVCLKAELKNNEIRVFLKSPRDDEFKTYREGCIEEISETSFHLISANCCTGFYVEGNSSIKRAVRETKALFSRGKIFFSLSKDEKELGLFRGDHSMFLMADTIWKEKGLPF